MAWLLPYQFALSIAMIFLYFRRNRARHPYPPGPPAEPILGNLRSMPLKDQEIVFRKWSKTYGDMIYLRILGRSYLIVNSLKVATDLLEKRSGIYSDRMRAVLYELMGWYPLLAFLPYGKQFQTHRRLMNEYLHQTKCIDYEPIQAQQARRLVTHLAESPQKFSDSFHRYAASIIVKVTYGRDVMSDDDPYVTIPTAALESITACGSMGSTPVDFMPFLRFLPSWFPGAYYAYKARSYRPAVRKMHDYPFEGVIRDLKEGTEKPSYLSKYLGELQGNYDDKQYMDDLKGSACMLYSGAAETTHSALLFFVLTMVLFPDVQRRAQDEIDNVLGKSRLPEFSDRSSLPYVEAVMQEVLRWHPVVPSGIPHSSITDDIYEGMFIPKGTVVIYNAYAILRDELVYSDPDSFRPSRYLPKPEGNGEPYPIGHFGFGRRICPGQYFGESSLWIATSTMLATLDIRRSVDENGNEIIPKVELLSGLTSHPKLFPCSIRPRDEASEALIKEAQIWDGDEVEPVL